MPRRIRLEMLYNNVTIIDDEREGAKLAADFVDFALDRSEFFHQ